VVAAGAGWWSWLQQGTRAAAKVEGEWWRRHWKGERVAAGGARERGKDEGGTVSLKKIAILYVSRKI